MLLNICRERREYARRLFQCMAVSIRPLRVDELAGVFAIQFDASALPSYDVTCQPEDSEEALLSTCSSLITVVKVEGSPVVQFSHFSVKEYLTSERLENAEKALSYYHIRPMSAHTTLAQASLSVLLTLNEQVDKNSMKMFPFAIYAAQHWVVHAQFENVSSSIEDAMGRLFNPIEPHFAVWVWIYDIDHQFRGIISEVHPTQPEAVPLYYATLCGFRNLVERLIVAFPQNIDAGGGYYGTPLHAALAKGYVDIALLLLQHSANVNALNEEGITPLHKACKRGLSDIVVWLLKHHANVDARDKNGDTPLLMASDAGERGIVEVLLEHGAHLDSRNKIGWTPLMSASQNGHPDIVELLLQRGATVDSSDDDGWTALTPAARHGHANVVDSLLGHGAAVNSSDKDGWTPLMSASQNGNLNVVEVLLQNGAVVDPRDNGGWTPLMTASRNGHLQVVRLLLRNGAAVDSRSNEGWTPLMLASEQGHLDIVQELLQSGASMDLRSHDGVASFGSALRFNGRKFTPLTRL
jgi:ankyrin repeat protein